MTNVISFPRRIEAKPMVTVRKSQAKTLFLYVKRATLIVHLSGAQQVAATGRASTR